VKVSITVTPSAAYTSTPRITADLREQGWRVSKNTVAEIMREQGLVARRKRRRWWLTQRDRNARKAPDLLRREFAHRSGRTCTGAAI
jgi:transposase InsO family protein